jgi:hypothetical protein
MVYYNYTKAATKVDDTHFTFAMPAESVIITTDVSVDGDITVNGDAVGVFAKEGNLFVARNVAFSSGRGNFNVTLKGEDGTKTNLTPMNIDRTKCFAGFDLSYGASSKSFLGCLSTGSSYDFFYDPNSENKNRPLYIKRVSVDSLPDSVNSLYGLFNGKVQSCDSVFPTNMIGVSIQSSTQNLKYTWALGTDKSSSLATSTSFDGKNASYSYRSYDETNKLLKTVDTKTGKAGKYLASHFSKSKDNQLTTDPTDELEFDGKKTQFVNPSVAKLMATANTDYDMYTIERSFMNAYRVGMTVEGTVKSVTRSITSAVDTDGGFTTKIVSGKTTGADSSDTSGTASASAHYEYRASLSFTKEGAIKEIEYTSKTYGSDLYDFGSDSFLDGRDGNAHFAADGTIKDSLSATYTYSETPAGFTFDATPYFITSIDSASITKDGGTANTINSGEDLNSYLQMSFTPSTALDSWQYQVIGSSDRDVVSYDSTYRRWIGGKPGSATATVSNLSDEAVKKDIDVTVNYSFEVNSFFIQGLDYSHKSPDSSSGDNLHSGDDVTYTINAKGHEKGKSNNVSIAMPLDTTADIFSATDKNGTNVLSGLGLVIAVDPSKNTIRVNASNVATSSLTTVKVKLNTAFYDAKASSTILIFTFLPGEASSFADIEGTWTYDPFASLTLSSTDKETVKGVEHYGSNLSVLTKDSTTGANVTTILRIAFDFVPATGEFPTATVVSATRDGADMDFNPNPFELKMDYTKADGLGIFLSESTWFGQDDNSVTYLLGDYNEDDDYGEYSYTVFVKAN